MDFLRFYKDEGYFILENIFSNKELQSYENTLRKIIRYNLQKYRKIHPELSCIKIGDELDGGMIALKNYNPKIISEIQRAISRTPEFFYMSAKPEIRETIRKIQIQDDDEPYYISNCGVIFAFPNSSNITKSYNIELGWHTDVFFTIPKTNFIHIWAPLMHDGTKEIGTVKAIPGSHKFQNVKHKFNPESDYNHRYSIEASEINETQACQIEVKKGSMLIFARDLIHASGSNKTDLVRSAMVGLYHNVRDPHFVPFITDYKYLRQTPEEYFYEKYKDESIKPILKEFSFLHDEPKAGV